MLIFRLKNITPKQEVYCPFGQGAVHPEYNCQPACLREQCSAWLVAVVYDQTKDKWNEDPAKGACGMLPCFKGPVAIQIEGNM